MKQINLFAENDCLAKLSKLGDQLEKLNKIIDWKMFEQPLRQVFAKEAKGTAGRPPYDYVMMFKILVLQRLFNLSDEQTEYQICDRLTFRRFLGLSLSERVPDAKTIWHFRNELTKANVMGNLFALFRRELEVRGIITREGTIVDATFVDTPRQRNTREENRQIKAGEVPKEWGEEKLRRKDIDARWAKKGNETHFGYKDHVKVDAKSKLILDYRTTAASVHDSQVFVQMLDGEDREVYGDSAYIGQEVPEWISAKISERGVRNHPLTAQQKDTNREKAKVRSRIEHVFGYMTGSMGGITFRGIGKARAAMWVGLTNLVYNMCRYATLRSKGISGDKCVQI